MKSPVNAEAHPANRLRNSVSKTTRSAGRSRRLLRGSARRGAAFFLTIFAAAIFYSASFAAPPRSAHAVRSAAPPASPARVSRRASTMSESGVRNNIASPFGFMPLFQTSGEETIETFAADCVTPKSIFILGETVCAKVTNASVLRPTRPLRRFSWVGPANAIRQQTNITSSTQTDLFTLPATQTTLIGDVLVDNRGEWMAISSNTTDGSTKARAGFSVRDPAQAAANLTLAKIVLGNGEVAAGSNVGFKLFLSNRGPDAAASVVLTDSVPANTTFVSGTQSSGPSFTCTNPSAGSTGTTNCTIASMPAGTMAEFIFVYEVGAGTPAKQNIVNTATVTSTTSDRNAADNTSSANAIVSATGGVAECTLSCPNNIIATANTFENSQPGAIVTFSAADPVGECGPLSTSHASGSFFPVGSTTVTTTSATGGGSCSFTVTVDAAADTTPPTINCPANITVTESAASSNSAAVTYTVTATDNSGTVDVSCDSPSGSSFPVGTTNVVCTATDLGGNVASCAFDVTVNESGCTLGTTPPTPNVTTLPTITRTCAVALMASDIPRATDSCGVQINATTTDPLTYNAAGTYTVHWTYTDGAGGITTQEQTVTVSPDTSAPVPDASSLPTLTGECSVTVATTPTATDNCAGSELAGTTTDPLTYNTPGTHTVHWNFTDAAGNITPQNQTVVVTDGAAPVPNVATLPTINGECSVTLTPPTAADNCAGTITATTSDPTTYTAQGTYTIHWTYNDGSGNTATQDQTVVVDDNTAPTITAPAAVSVNADAVSCAVSGVALGSPTAADNCTVNVSNNAPASFPLGTTTVTWTATDGAGNTATATQLVTVVDATAPVMSCPTNIVVNLPVNSAATSMAVSYPAATATDNCGGSLPVNYSQASGSVFNVGTTTVTASATDAAGNTASCTFTVTVLYNFTGFFSPVSNLPTINNVNAGRAIPVKFSLSGNKGLGIMAAGYPASQQIACDSSAPISNLEGTETSGGSTLSYSPDQYHYNWKTESSWAGTCRVLIVKLNDGTEHTALFKFK